MAQYDEALRLDSERQEAHTNMALLLETLGRPSEALEHHRKALEIAPNTAEEQLNLGQCLATLDRSDEALDAFREAIRLAPGKAEPYAAAAKTLCARNGASPEDLAEALRLAQKAITNSRRANTLEIYAQACAANGDFERAIALTEEALKLPGSSKIPGFGDRLRAALHTYRSAAQR